LSFDRRPDLGFSKVLLVEGKSEDFRTTADVDRVYLRAEKRIASLSMLGWAHFRQRLTLHYTRANLRQATLMDNSVSKDTWTELELWQEWSAKKGGATGSKLGTRRAHRNCLAFLLMMRRANRECCSTFARLCKPS